MRKVVIIIQARLGSSRFKAKMLMPLAGIAVTQWVYRRASLSKLTNEIVVATTTNPVDDLLASYCEQWGIQVFRGSENDVMSRYYECSKHFGASHVVRITGDCPFIDPTIIDEVVQMALTSPTVQYAHNVEPVTFPEGMSAEVLSFETLEWLNRNVSDPYHRTHVTSYIRDNLSEFETLPLNSDPDLSNIRLTLDHPEDFIALDEIGRLLHARHGFDFSMEQTLDVLVNCDNARMWLSLHERDQWRRVAHASSSVG